MGRALAARLCLAHLFGLHCLMAFGILTSPSFDYGEITGFFLALTSVSMMLFVPILLVCLVFAKGVLAYPIAFSLLGTIYLASMGYMVLNWMGLFALGGTAACASLAFVALSLRGVPEVVLDQD